jgi:hypothetical protein
MFALSLHERLVASRSESLLKISGKKISEKLGRLWG